MKRLRLLSVILLTGIILTSIIGCNPYHRAMDERSTEESLRWLERIKDTSDIVMLAIKKRNPIVQKAAIEKLTDPFDIYKVFRECDSKDTVFKTFVLQKINSPNLLFDYVYSCTWDHYGQLALDRITDNMSLAMLLCRRYQTGIPPQKVKEKISDPVIFEILNGFYFIEIPRDSKFYTDYEYYVVGRSGECERFLLLLNFLRKPEIQEIAGQVTSMKISVSPLEQKYMPYYTLHGVELECSITFTELDEILTGRWRTEFPDTYVFKDERHRFKGVPLDYEALLHPILSRCTQLTLKRIGIQTHDQNILHAIDKNLIEPLGNERIEYSTTFRPIIYDTVSFIGNLPFGLYVELQKPFREN